MQKYFWDQVDESIKPVEIVGEGTLYRDPVFAISIGEYIEWVRPEALHDTIDEHLTTLAANAKKRAKLKQ